MCPTVCQERFKGKELFIGFSKINNDISAVPCYMSHVLGRYNAL